MPVIGLPADRAGSDAAMIAKMVPKWGAVNVGASRGREKRNDCFTKELRFPLARLLDDFGKPPLNLGGYGVVGPEVVDGQGRERQLLGHLASQLINNDVAIANRPPAMLMARTTAGMRPFLRRSVETKFCKSSSGSR